MKRQIADIKDLEAQDYTHEVILFGDHPRRLVARLEMFHGNMVLNFRVYNGPELVKEATVLRWAVDAYNEL